MQFMYDVWVNWCEGAGCRDHVWYFHEWRKSDCIELLEQVPVVKVPFAFYERIEDEMEDIPLSLLQDVYKKAFIRRKSKKEYLEYCAIVTNGVESIVFNTMGYSIPLRKSRLVPRHEKIVVKVGAKLHIPSYLVGSECKKSVSSCDLGSLAYVGLTRREKEQKKILLAALERLKDANDINELRYWYTECFPDCYVEALELDFSLMWEKIEQSLLMGWTKRHYELCIGLIQENLLLMEEWSLITSEEACFKKR